jgi:hypothetical protein
MSAFSDLLNEYIGVSSSIADIRVAVRRLWFYDFVDQPVRLWQGIGKLITIDDNEWLGTVGGDGNDQHKVPSLQDGRDGTSPTYNFSISIPDLPGQDAFTTYNQIKADQSRVYGRSLTCYLVIVREGEALRPQTPISFYKQLTMQSPKFSESTAQDANGTLVRNFTVSVAAKDGNVGRSSVPRGTYANAIQKERAKQLGVALDRGSEFLALLANRTYTVP